jgi:transcriptional regulator with XRE-family HTH domain
LPFYRWSLTTAKPISGYPDTLEHVGHHLLKRRLDLGLQQKGAAKILGTGASNLRNWETGRHGIQNWHYPKVIRFLGYNPLPAATTRGEAIRRERLSRGWSRRRLGRLASADEGTIRRIEADTPRVGRKPLQRVLTTLGIDCNG